MMLTQFMNLFPEFRASSWNAWRKILGRITQGVSEFYAICGRAAGKSRIVGLIGAWAGTGDYKRAPGEYIYVGIFGPDRKQSRITFRYIGGLLRSVPALAALIVAETADSIELVNGVIIEVITATKAAPRGRAYKVVIIEEGAFLPTEFSAEPDVELLRAVRPALARVPNSLLCVISTPYARRGIIWTAWQKYHGQPDSNVVFVQAPTLALNPTFDRKAIERALEEDPSAARAEYLAEFRSDVESFVAREVVEAAIVPARRELPCVSGIQYTFFHDEAGGSGGDSRTTAWAHKTSEGVAVLDGVREWRPPFSPEQAIAEAAELMRVYNVCEGTADRYAGDFPVEHFRKHGITIRPAEKSKSDFYKELLGPLNSGKIELLDHPKLTAQLCGLERRTARGGRDSIDHAPTGHDDLINAAAGALVLAAVEQPKPFAFALPVGPAGITDAIDIFKQSLAMRGR